MDTNLSPTYAFLKKLEKNNSREWFSEHKNIYLDSHENIIGFADALLQEMQHHDDIETISGKKSVFRIYRDTRFSKDKTPYKNNWGGGFKRATEQRRGGYYFQIQPGNTFVAGGFWGPNAQDLLHIRKQISQDSSSLRDTLNEHAFADFFGTMRGDQLKTSPKGFDKDDPAIDLLRYKQFTVRHDFTDQQALSPGFHKEMNKAFMTMRPFLDCMTEILITDLNGTPLF